MISNARDIFKHLESQEDNQPERKQIEKVRRVEVKPDFLLDGQNKAEELRKERLKEMTAMKMARERQLEEDERYQNSEKNRGDELRKQREREMDMMRMARQQALEEEERVQAESAKRFVREVSPGLAAARQGFKIDRLEEDDKLERIRIERERELESMRKARAMQLEEEMFEQSRTQKSEASRELEAFRASRGQQPLGERYSGNQNQENQDQQLRRAPRSKRIADNWMKQDEEDKIEEMRRARERELEMMMNARNIAFEEEEEERLYQEALRREEAERKGREMAMLVAELQRMRNETQESGIQDEKMTKYQEEMLQRVMELHAIARGGLLSN
ncbi:trichohyalin [Eurytemora carolleeae]|uniref:trichohyalin n=1 Tax=Eurytemora carolleeae TaxID=1294199 RepID=UPI000C758341|nr:trichohyalin [Eurytemora carolleeae]|eukprot:XP_023340219.1 trichohyalin-like [Eurytemora affinis]